MNIKPKSYLLTTKIEIIGKKNNVRIIIILEVNQNYFLKFVSYPND